MMTNRKNQKSDKPYIAQIKKTAYALRRLFPSYLLCFIPFLVFGSKSDLRLILWKIAVVGTGLLIFHFARKSMFPYIDLRKAFEEIYESPDDVGLLAKSIFALAQAVVVSAMAFAVIFSIAGGI